MVKDFRNKKVLVVGDIMLDGFHWGEVERVNPEQPASHLVNIYEQTYSLGGAANTANNLSSLGAEVTLIGIIGDDSYGKIIKDLSKNSGIKLIPFTYNQTIVKNRIMAHGQQISRQDYGERMLLNDRVTKTLNEIPKYLEETLNSAIFCEMLDKDIVVLSDYNKYLFRGNLSQRVIDLSSKRGKKIISAPKPENIEKFKHSYVICVNRSEAEKISGISYSPDQYRLITIGQEINRIANPSFITITCGEDGVFSYNNGNSEMIGTKARKVADVTGAGDTFLSALSLGIASSLNIHDASKIANAAAGAVVEKPGTATTNINEILEHL